MNSILEPKFRPRRPDGDDYRPSERTRRAGLVCTVIGLVGAMIGPAIACPWHATGVLAFGAGSFFASLFACAIWDVFIASPVERP